MIEITKYTKPKKNATSSNGFANVINNTTVINNGSDIDITIDSQLSETSSNAVANSAITTAINDVKNSSISAITNADNTLTITSSGRTWNIDSNTWKFDNNGNLIFDGNIIIDNATLQTLTADTVITDDLQAAYLTSDTAIIDNLTVTKAAHFFELIIDQIKSTQGQIIITPANAKLDRVDEYADYYRCYWKNEDDERQIGNEFAVNDQIVCQTFNVTTGTSYNADNKYYWALVVNTGSTTIDNEQYHYIDISKTDKDSNSNGIPSAGDEIAQLGNRSDTSRQSAIIISAYNNQFLDPTITAPSIVQYSGIRTYNLAAYRLNTISKSFNQFKGKFETNSGDDIEDLIDSISSGTTMYIHTAYSNSADGQTDFSKTYFNGASYIGMCSNFNPSDSDLIYSNYTWMRMKGEDGDAGFSYNLLPIQESAIVQPTDVLSLVLGYQLVKVEGNTVTTINPSTSNFYMRFKADNSSSYTQLTRSTTAFTYSTSNYMSNYHTAASKPTYFVVELYQNSKVLESNVVNVTFNAGATLTIKDDITASVQSVSGDLNTYKQTANASISSLTNRMGTAESNITQTQTDITSEVTARINGDKKYFPIVKPFYDYDGNIVTDYLSDPIRYDGGADIYSTPIIVANGEYKFKIYCSISSNFDNYFQICTFGNRYPNSIGDDYDTLQTTFTRGTNTIRCKDGTTLYEYTADISVPSNGYYCINFFGDNQYIYWEESDTFEKNYSRITQTNNRITSEVGNINGQISTIEQKADSIEATVNDVSLRLDNGGFVINADTEINGTLSLNNSNNAYGFILNGTGGSTYIYSDSIGTYNQFKQKSVNTVYVSLSSNTQKSGQTVTFTNTLDIGNLPLQKTIEFRDLRIAAYFNDTSSVTMNGATYSFLLKKDGTTVATFTGATSAVTSIGSYTTNNVNGIYTLECTWTITASKSTKISSNIWMNIQIPSQSFTMIGYDGIASNFGSDKTVYIGNDGTYIRYNDDNVLRVSTLGIQKYAGPITSQLMQGGYATDTCYSNYVSEYSYIHGAAVRNITTGGMSYLKPNDQFIMIQLTQAESSNRVDFFLGVPNQNIGRIIYFKRTNDYGGIRVYAGNNYSNNYRICTADNGSYEQYRTTASDNSMFYISDGQYWNEFYCG